MQVQDDFIVGIFNYCDRWCETCRFTSWCRVFASAAEAEARLDPSLEALTRAPRLRSELPPPPPRWMQELLDDANEACASRVSAPEMGDRAPAIAVEHEPLQARALEYSIAANRWLVEHDGFGTRSPDDPRSVIAWYQTLIPAKIDRALAGVQDEFSRDDDRPDHDGSAKVALIGLDRSRAAWLDARDRGLAAADAAARFVADLAWLGQELERVFPKARAFVRPAFDEPDEVAKLGADRR